MTLTQPPTALPPTLRVPAGPDVLGSARATLRAEAHALTTLARTLDDRFVEAVELLLAAPGRVIVTGLGKSGLIGGKIAATLASTGTPASFVHAADALHGDAGMLAEGDVLLALSNSGQTAEVCEFADIAVRRGAQVVALTGDATSPLARVADAVLEADVEREADPLGLAPTTSTTAALALGDAMAIALMQRRGFTAEDFARNHPGGALGRALHGEDGGRG